MILQDEEDSGAQVADLCDQCGSPKNTKNKFLPPRIGRKHPQVNN